MRPNRAALALAALLPLAAGCKKQPPPELPPQNRLESYAFDPSSPPESRAKMIPAFVLDFFRAFDNRPDYAGHEPSAAEKELLARYLKLLPAAYAKGFRERCVGIYFVPGMLGNGLTDWVAGPDGKVYFYIVLDAAVFAEDISRTLSVRESSAFAPRKDWSVRVEAGGAYKGLLYALAHEGAHGLDYAYGVTPYTDDTMPELYRPRKARAGDFTMKRWQSYSKPRKEADFYGRESLKFYGLGGGPKLDISEAPAVYDGMLRAGFVSLYGARSWAEELAELAFFGALDALGQPYRVVVKSPGGEVSYAPLRNAGQLTYEAVEYLNRI